MFRIFPQDFSKNYILSSTYYHAHTIRRFNSKTKSSEKKYNNRTTAAFQSNAIRRRRYNAAGMNRAEKNWVAKRNKQKKKISNIIV